MGLQPSPYLQVSVGGGLFTGFPDFLHGCLGEGGQKWPVAGGRGGTV